MVIIPQGQAQGTGLKRALPGTGISLFCAEIHGRPEQKAVQILEGRIMKLSSYVSGAWAEGNDEGAPLVDPVTGEDRVLSGEGDVRKPLSLNNENRYAFSVDFRQDFEVARFAWGWNLRKRGNRFEFKVDELVEHEEGYDVNVFVETTRWWGLKMRLDAQNLTDFHQYRSRTRYTGERGLSPLDVNEIRDRTDGVRVLLTLAGSF